MKAKLRFVHVRLEAPADRLQALTNFYGRELGIGLAVPSADRFSLAIGETAIEFVAGSGEPFYHFALLVPGNRFDEAFDWAGGRTELQPDPESGETLFDFDNWGASACYFNDPAGNIVELIAHRGLDETGAQGEFRPQSWSVSPSSDWLEIRLRWLDGSPNNWSSRSGTAPWSSQGGLRSWGSGQGH